MEPAWVRAPFRVALPRLCPWHQLIAAAMGNGVHAT